METSDEAPAAVNDRGDSDALKSEGATIGGRGHELEGLLSTLEDTARGLDSEGGPQVELGDGLAKGPEESSPDSTGEKSDRVRD